MLFVRHSQSPYYIISWLVVLRVVVLVIRSLMFNVYRLYRDFRFPIYLGKRQREQKQFMHRRHQDSFSLEMAKGVLVYFIKDTDNRKLIFENAFLLTKHCGPTSWQLRRTAESQLETEHRHGWRRRIYILDQDVLDWQVNTISLKISVQFVHL